MTRNVDTALFFIYIQSLQGQFFAGEQNIKKNFKKEFEILYIKESKIKS